MVGVPNLKPIRFCTYTFLTLSSFKKRIVVLAHELQNRTTLPWVQIFGKGKNLNFLGKKQQEKWKEKFLIRNEEHIWAVCLFWSQNSFIRQS